MAVHDEIMPKMGDIMKYKKQLKAKIDALTEAGQEENEAKIAELTKAVDDLENSHEEMMNWMREFDNDFEGMVQQEVMDYLKDQMTKIENVGKITNTAIKNAQELLTD
jgi:methylthioribose-1-phosphate isomerase